MTFTSKNLLDRLSIFAQKCRDLTTKLPNTSYNKIYNNQLIRSSSSPGANYIEAIEAASTKEFVLRLKICRKELKESGYWIALIQTSNIQDSKIQKESEELKSEAEELIKIFTASIITSERNQKIQKMNK